MSGIPVVDRLRSELERGQEAGELQPGSRLPTEREFADSLSVSRSSVRQALGVLEREGMINRHVGRGTFLNAADRRLAGAQDLMTSPAEIMDTRLMIEPEVAVHAARNATPSDLTEIERCMRRGNACEAYMEFEAWDAEFHRAIAVAVHNDLLLRMFDTMNAARDLPVWGKSKIRSATKERRKAYEQQHLDILTALIDRDPTAAHAAMQDHLLSVKSNLLNPPR